MNNILVSGASGVVGYGILRSLQREKERYRLIGSSIDDRSPALGFCDVFEKCPRTSDAGYFDWLQETIRKHSVDLVIPGIEIDLYAWTKFSREIESFGTRIALNNKDLISLCEDKWNFFESIESHESFAIPTSLNSNFDAIVMEFGLPFLLKPRKGFGSKGIVHINDEEQFKNYRSEIGGKLMVQPIVGTNDEEFTCGVFGDGQGNNLASITMRRKLSKDGFTNFAEVIHLPDVDKVLESLCKIFNPVGPTNFQFRRHTGEIKLLEVNPRISSSTSMRAAFGYNESLMAVEYFVDGKQPSQPKILDGWAVRYSEDLIFYS